MKISELTFLLAWPFNETSAIPKTPTTMKKKLQPVHFNSVDDCLDYLPEEERMIVDYLRELIHECIPNCREKLSYNVPYYYRHSRICFIWPSSIPWGKVKLSGVQLGFCNGHLLHDDLNYLEKGDRKQVCVKTFQDIRDIDPDLVRTCLFEAMDIDEQLKRDKQERRKS